MKRFHILWRGLLIAFSLLILAESAQAKVGAKIVLINPNLQMVRIGDLDFNRPGPKRDLFYLLLFNDGRDVPIRLQFEIFYNNNRIASGTTNEFILPATPPGGLRVPQRQLIDGTIPDGKGGFIRIKMQRYQIDADKLENFQNKVFSTGRLPSGKYIFQIKVETNELPPDQVFPPSRELLILRNPSNIFLIYPGVPVSAKDVPEIPSPYPQLQWQSDANIFNIYVYEKRPEDRTVQQVLNRPPFLRVEKLQLPPTQRQFFFQYPTTTQPLRFKNGGRSVGPIRPLQPGKVYYWFVEGVIPTSGNDVRILKSDVYKFRIMSRDAAQVQKQQIVNLLTNLMGPKGQRLIKKLLDDGYSPTGRVRINGKPMTLQEFSQYLLRLQTQKARIGRIEIN